MVHFGFFLYQNDEFWIKTTLLWSIKAKKKKIVSDDMLFVTVRHLLQKTREKLPM